MVLGEGYNANVYIIIGNNSYAVIDAGLPENYEVIKDALTELDIENKNGFLILTHMHYDHSGAANKLARKFGLKIIAHKAEQKYLERGDAFHTAAILFGTDKIDPIKITKTVKNDESLKLGNINLEIISTPGHTVGSICIYVPQRKILISGDTVFANGAFGRTDLPTGNIKDLRRSLQKLRKLKINILLPGHGNYVKTNAEEHVAMASSFLEQVDID